MTASLARGIARMLLLGSTLGVAAGLTLVAPLAAHAQQKPAASAKARAVIQVSDNDAAKWNLALNNARNVQQDLGADQSEIEIVAYGPGINMLKMDSTVANRIADALKAGVQVVACENTMTNQKLKRDDMLPAIGYVSSGVTEIMKKQREGWAYIRP